MKPEQERLRTVLSDTVTLLCKSGLQFGRELKVQGLLGITVDDDEVFIVHINEAFSGGSNIPGTPGSVATKNPMMAQPSRSPAPGRAPGNTSGALVPYTSPAARPAMGSAKRTPQSAGRRLRGGMVGGLSSMSPAAKQAALKAKQKLQFPSGAGVGRGGMSARGALKSPRGGGAGRGGPPAGYSPVSAASPRGGMSGGMKSPMASPVRPILATNSPAHNVPQGSTPKGKGTPGKPSQPPMSSPNHMKMMGQGQLRQQQQQVPGTAAQNHGFVSKAGPQFSGTNPPPLKRLKTEIPETSDVIDLDDDGPSGGDQYSSVLSTTDNNSAALSSGMVQQTQITRVTITTNEQGQPVRQYERVQSATVPALGPAVVSSTAGGHAGVKVESTSYTADDFLQDISHQGQDNFSSSYTANPNDAYYYQSTSGGYQGDQTYQDPAMLSGANAGFSGDYLMGSGNGSWAAGDGGLEQTAGGGWMSGMSGYQQMKTDTSDTVSGYSNASSGSTLQSPGGKVGRGGGQGGSRGAGRGGSRGAARGAGARRPNAESFTEVKGRGAPSAEGDGTWKMVARFVCSIPGCEQSFSNKSNLLRHQNQKHGRDSSLRGGGGGSDVGSQDEYGDEIYGDQ